MKRILLSLIAFAGVWMTAGAQTNIDGYKPVLDNENANLEFKPSNVTVSGTTCYRTSTTTGVTFTLESDAYSISKDNNAINVYRFSSNNEQNTTVNFTWSCEANHYVAISNVELETRCYISGTVYCDIDGKDKKVVSTQFVNNKTLTNSYQPAKEDAPIKLNYAKSGRTGTLSNAGKVYIGALNATYTKYHYVLDLSKANQPIADAQALYNGLSDDNKATKEGKDLLNAITTINNFKTDNVNTVADVEDGTLLEQFNSNINALQAAIDAFSCTLNEGNAYEAANKTVTKVKVERKMKGNGIWNTLCLPFNTPVPAGWTVKELASVTYESGTYDLKFQQVATIEAGKPYIAKVGSDIDVYTFEDTHGFTLVESPASVEKTADNGGKASFKGSYEIISIAKDDDNFVIDNANKFHLVDIDNVKIKGFRGYFHIDESNVTGATGSALCASFDDEETGISSVNENAYENENLYNIAGQRIGENAKGIIIKNGKKYIVK